MLSKLVELKEVTLIEEIDIKRSKKLKTTFRANLHPFSQKKVIIFLDFGIILIGDELGGTLQNFCTFNTPYQTCFIAFLKKNFLRFSKFVLLILAIFLKNVPKFPKNIKKP